MKNIFNDCKWAVAYKIDKETQDDRKTKIRVVALFDTPSNAEDFIEKSLPEETKERFFIIDIDELESCEDCDKVQKVTSLYAKVIQPKRLRASAGGRSPGSDDGRLKKIQKG